MILLMLIMSMKTTMSIGIAHPMYQPATPQKSLKRPT